MVSETVVPIFHCFFSVVPSDVGHVKHYPGHIRLLLPVHAVYVSVCALLETETKLCVEKRYDFV